jgi:hypothetical protein
LDVSAYETVKPDSFLCEKINKFSNQLLMHCFNPIMQSVFPEFQRETDRLNDDDRVHFFTFQAFMFSFMLSKRGEGLSIGNISEALNV